MMKPSLPLAFLYGLALISASGSVFGQPVPIPPVVLNATLASPGLEPGVIDLQGIRLRIVGDAAGIRAVTLPERGPSRAIPINRKAGLLHVLHTAEPGPGVAGIEESGKVPAHPPQVFGYELTYADGGEATLHMDWRHHVAPIRETVERPRYLSCWPVRRGDFHSYHAVVPNPYPDKTIAFLRLAPPEKGAAMVRPYLIALGTATAPTVEAGGVEWALADYDLSHGPVRLEFDAETGRLGVPMHGKSDRGAVAHVPEPFTGDFSARLRLVDLPLTAPWGFVGLTVSDRIGFSGRGGVEFRTGVFFKPAREQDAEKKGLFHQTAGKPAVGELVMAERKPPVRLDDAEFDDATPVWLGIERLGRVITTRRSVDGETWTEVDSRDYPELPDELFLAIYTALSHGPRIEHVYVDEITVVP